jgi:cardiolipin synthase
MRTVSVVKPKTNIDLPIAERDFFDDVFERVTQAPLIHGNDVKLLRDAKENYPEWLAAIDGAESYIYFESYIIHEDEQGKIFADALIKKAKDGVEVRLIYDWLGGFGKTSRKYWRHLRQNGVDVRVYNPPRLTDPLGFVTRDHRKILVVDGKTAFVTGLCVGQDWIGHPEKGVPGWRDTGVKINGPAVRDVEDSFAAVWKTTGAPLERKNRPPRPDDVPGAGSVALRVVQSVPGSANIYRMDQLLASAARESMWFTDAYFIGLPSYLQGLKDAAADGVDVRILVPQSTDIALITDTTRSTYRPLLEAGVRVFEWNGPMMHAKTAVFDGQFTRVGSTNLNIASWLGNYELDVLIEDAGFGKKMQEMFLLDLENATEIVLDDTRPKSDKPRRRRPRRHGGGSMRKATAGALNAATSIGSAITKRMPLGAGDARLLLIVGTALLLLAALFIFFPRIASIPLIVVLLLLAIPALAKAFQSYRNN